MTELTESTLKEVNNEFAAVEEVIEMGDDKNNEEDE